VAAAVLQTQLAMVILEVLAAAAHMVIYQQELELQDKVTVEEARLILVLQVLEVVVLVVLAALGMLHHLLVLEVQELHHLYRERLQFMRPVVVAAQHLLYMADLVV
jgi:hypothetical protein